MWQMWLPGLESLTKLSHEFILLRNFIILQRHSLSVCCHGGETVQNESNYNFNCQVKIIIDIKI